VRACQDTCMQGLRQNSPAAPRLTPPNLSRVQCVQIASLCIPAAAKAAAVEHAPTLCRSSLRGIRGCTVCCSMRMRWVWPGSIRPQLVPGRRSRQATAYASIPEGWLPTQGWKAFNLVRICTAMLLRPLTISLCQVLHLTRHISCGQHHHAHSMIKIRVHKP
jgi:hypothetical protein